MLIRVRQTVVLSAATSDAETTATSDTAEAEGTKGSFQEVPSRLTGSARYEELTEKGKLLVCACPLAPMHSASIPASGIH